MLKYAKTGNAEFLSKFKILNFSLRIYQKSYIKCI